MSYKKEKCDAVNRDAIWSFLLLYIKKKYVSLFYNVLNDLWYDGNKFARTTISIQIWEPYRTMSLLYNDYHARINSLIWDNGKPKYGDETQIEQLQQWSSVVISASCQMR